MKELHHAPARGELESRRGGLFQSAEDRTTGVRLNALADAYDRTKADEEIGRHTRLHSAVREWMEKLYETHNFMTREEDPQNKTSQHAG